jgi:hypothetical protein
VLWSALYVMISQSMEAVSTDDPFGFHVGQLEMSLIRGGPLCRSSLFSYCVAVITRVSKSAEFESVGHYFHICFPVKSLISLTLFCTNLGKCFSVSNQYRTIWLSYQR